MKKIYFDKGECRHVKLLIHAVDDAPFTIHGAHYELMWAGEIEASGGCAIDGHVLDAYISPKNKTTYRLRITYTIADETLVEQIDVEVT